MEMIELNERLINKYFGWLESGDCLEEVKELVAEYGAVVDPENGEMILDNVGLGIFTDYFKAIRRIKGGDVPAPFFYFKGKIMEKKFKEVSFWNHNSLSSFRVMHNTTLKKALKEAKSSGADYICWYDIPAKIDI